jgi:hypothetical protein
MPIILESSNEELHQRLIQRSKDRQREEYIAVLHTRQYPLPVVLLKIVISYLPGYFMHWLPSGELIFKQEMSLAKPMWNYVKPQSQIKYDDADDNDDNDYSDDEYADYEKKYNPESDDY